MAGTWTNWLAALGAVALAGCVSVKSRHVDYQPGGIDRGVHYAAPKGLLRIELVEDAGEVFLAVSEPFFVGDPEASYAIKGASGLFSTQDYKVVVDPETRLLQHVSSVSEGELGNIAVALAKSVTGVGALSFESSADTGPRVIYSRVVDPFDLAGCDFATACGFEDINAALHRIAFDYLDCAPNGPGPGEIYTETCDRLRAAPDFFQISLDPLFQVTPDRRGRIRRDDADRCRASVCYRAPVPYSLGVQVKGLTEVSEIVLMPNEGPVFALDVPAGLFADSVSRLTLVNGMPVRFRVYRENELAALALLPLDVIRGAFSAVGEVLQLRINLDTTEQNFFTSATGRDIARDARDDFVRERRDRLDEEAEARRLEEEAEDPDSIDLGFGGEPPLESSAVGRENSFGDEAHDEQAIAASPAARLIVQPAPRLFRIPIARRADGAGGPPSFSNSE